MNGVTVLVPTIGRESLYDCFRSFAFQLNPEDSVVVISDGESEKVRAMVRAYADIYPSPDWMYVGIEPQGCWGHPAANYALDNDFIQTSHVWRLDDDDQASPDALESIRASLDDSWSIFKMEFGQGHPARGVVCWREPHLRFGDVGTPMVVAPRSSARFGLRYEGDWDYVQALKDEFGDPAWNDKVIALIRP